MSSNTLLEKISASIAHKEREIIDEFCKAFLAQKSLEGIPIEDIFKHYTLCTNPIGGDSNRYWFEKKREFEEEF